MSHVPKFFLVGFEQKSCSKKREAMEKMTYIRNFLGNIRIFRNPNTMKTDENYKQIFFLIINVFVYE